VKCAAGAATTVTETVAVGSRGEPVHRRLEFFKFL